MRLAISLLLLAASACGNAPAAGSDEQRRPAQPGSPALAPDVPVGGPGEPAATISIASTGGVCSARWNGEPVSFQALRERSAATVAARLSTVPQDTSTESANAPHVRLESPAEVPWTCIEPVVAVLRDARFASLLLRITGRGTQLEPRATFIFPVQGISFNYTIVEIEGSGRLRLDGRLYAVPAFPEAFVDAAVRMEFAGMFGTAVVPRPGARFADVHDAFRILYALESRPFLSNCRDATPPEGVTLRC